MAWTKSQQKVIDTRNKNLLVSAAAGSGKTAVLVERIISMISEGDKPLDIDHLLVVTFTNAAAAEMRERIGIALDKKLCDNPDNEHLQKQVSLLQSAQITTIHSFCLNVIRNYFHRIDLDPSFKIADEADITLMKSDVVSDLLERWYEEGREDFHKLIESYSYSKSDTPIEELILQLYNFSMSSPWPKEWINDKRKIFELKDLDDLYSALWMKELLEYIGIVIKDLAEKNAHSISICNESGGPTAYIAALISDRTLLEKLREAKTYEELAVLCTSIAFDRLSNKREEGVDPSKKDIVKAIREDVKKGLKDLAGQYFFQAPEEMLKDMQAVNECMQVLFDLTLEFMDDFAAKKEEKNLIDFSDIEHYALSILVQKKRDDNSSYSYTTTQAALELSEQFEEILIDEYQDSNMVQETILKSISREETGRPNRFMVGDVKQSIYKFRLAMPEIFMEKYANYKSEELNEDGKCNFYQKIDLDRNFRSRRIVIEYVNNIFEQIMHEQIGGIEYDEAAALKYGEVYDDNALLEALGVKDKSIYSGRIADTVDYMLITDEELQDEQPGDELFGTEHNNAEQHTKETGLSNPGSPNNQEDETDYTKKELEALLIVEKIKELTDSEKGMLIFDKSIKAFRKASYKDIVILLRSMNNWSEVFVKTLMREGIPAYADTGTGYFQTLEVMNVLNMLRIIDNPRQDIPLVGVLYSPMVGLSAEELARIRIGCRNTGMYTAVTTYAIEGVDEPLRKKINSFINMLDTFRAMVNHTPIHEIIQSVLDRTGYYYYVSTMPSGNQRKANLDMLISYAVRFENGSYSGLFHFVRYIEKLHKYEIDFGEASASGEEDDTVRIMSIHKSKGLEFPIVFLAGMNKQFNTQDIRSSIILHSELGVGPEYVDTGLRTKVPTLLKKVIQKKVQIENLGEELRVLYVAMTRAREKLIMTGYVKSKDEITGKKFTFSELLSARSFQDLVLPAMINRIGDITSIDKLPYTIAKDSMTISITNKKDFVKQEVAKQLFLKQEQDVLLSINPDVTYSTELKEEIKTKINFIYPFNKESGLKIKLTVSEIKKLSQFYEEDMGVNLYEPQKIEEGGEVKATLPDFIRKNIIEISGTDRGTLYHKVLELLDLTRIRSRNDFMDQIQVIIGKGLIQIEDIKKLNQDYIYRFTQSNVAERMRKAQLLNKLFKEKQFVMGVKASEVVQESNSDELILIQGIIDVFFEEEGELILLDYKSDIVDNEEQLIRRYRTQLDYYSKALTQILHKRVKEMIIYSLPLAKEVRIDR